MGLLTTLTRVLPPPRYITLPAMGIDISDTSLKYVQFERVHAGDPNLALAQWGDIPVPHGIVERGTVPDKGALAEVLKSVKKKTGALYVNLSLPEERAYLFETTLPRGITDKHARELIEFRLEENVPLSPRDAYFDHTYMKSTAGDTAEEDVLVAVYAQEVINSYYEACVTAELLPLSFEIEAQAIARSSIPRDEEGAFLVIDFGKTRTGIGIVHNGTLAYTSTVDISGIQLSDAMRHVLGDIAEAELTTIKNTKGIVPMSGNEAVAKALLEIMHVLVEELSVRMHYWHTRKNDNDERRIKKVFLCGGSSNMWGLPEFLTDVLKVPVERSPVWQNAFSLNTYVPPITRPYSYGYATAIGLALRRFVSSV